MGEAVADSSVAERLSKAIQAREARICVVGMGYVGLPLTQTFIDAGFPVMGYDVDEAKVEALREGRSYIAQMREAAAAGEYGRSLFDRVGLQRCLGELIREKTEAGEDRHPPPVADFDLVEFHREDVARQQIRTTRQEVEIMRD